MKVQFFKKVEDPGRTGLTLIKVVDNLGEVRLNVKVHIWHRDAQRAEPRLSAHLDFNLWLGGQYQYYFNLCFGRYEKKH